MNMQAKTQSTSRKAESEDRLENELEDNKGLDPLGDGKSCVELIDWMGGDLSVVNDAKASFDKQADEVGDREVRLLNYLIKENHNSPLRGTVFKFRVRAPLFICRQWWKHVVASNHNDEQLGWNERSFRYLSVRDEDCTVDSLFYIPLQFHKQNLSNKQASGEPLSAVANGEAYYIYEKACHSSFSSYKWLIETGVSRETARGVLVPSIYTTWVWTTSLEAVLNFIDLRTGKGAQSEIALYAKSCRELVEPIAPQVMKAWRLHRG